MSEVSEPTTAPYRRKLPSGRHVTVLFEGTPEECDAWEFRFRCDLAAMRAGGAPVRLPCASIESGWA